MLHIERAQTGSRTQRCCTNKRIQQLNAMRQVKSRKLSQTQFAVAYGGPEDRQRCCQLENGPQLLMILSILDQFHNHQTG